MGVFPSVLMGTGPSYKLAAAARRKTEICLRSFGQIARRRRAAFIRQTAQVAQKNSWAINGCGKMRL